jgi:Zn-dependent M16 (insulinase) family peptidase
LKESAFLTEIHHITETGEDGGVVYSEMQGRENMSYSVAHDAFMKKMFDGCAYASETGGKLENLRDLTNDKSNSISLIHFPY